MLVEDDMLLAAGPANPVKKKTSFVRFLRRVAAYWHPSWGNQNVRSTNLTLRIIFVSSLGVIGALAVAAMIVVANGLTTAILNGEAILNVSIIRYFYSAAVEQALRIVIDPTNSTLLVASIDPLFAGYLSMTIGLEALEHANGALNVTHTITSPGIRTLWVEMAPFAESTAASFFDIVTELVGGAAITGVTPTIVGNVTNIINQELGVLVPLNFIQLNMTEISQDQMNDVRDLNYIFMGIILGVLSIIGLCAYLPLERRIKHLFDSIVQRNEDLKRASEDLSILMRLNPNAITRTNAATGQASFVNERWTELTGLRVHDSHDWIMFVQDSDRDMVLAAWLLALRDPKAHMKAEFVFVRPTDNAKIVMMARTLPEVDSAGNVRSLVCAFADVSERLQLERSRLDALALVAETSEARAREAEQHRREQERFVDMICHEIRNPLNGIVNNMDMLLVERADILASLRKLTTADVKDIIDRIEGQEALWDAIELCADHQRRITDDVLQISRLHAGHFGIQERVFLLQRLVDSVMNTFRAEAESSNVALVLDAPSIDKDMRLRGDSHRISQVLVNLLSNAIKFTRNCNERKVTFAVAVETMSAAEFAECVKAALAARREDASSSESDFTAPPSDGAFVRLVFSIIDTGIGMTSEESGRLFKPFMQASSKTYSNYGGSGMGLFISRALTDLLGGTIAVTSKVGEGSTFVFSVPCAIASPSSELDSEVEPIATRGRSRRRQSNKSPGAHLASPPVTSPSSQRRILVAEDNDINRAVLRKQFETAPGKPYTVDLAANGREAIDMYLHAVPPYDLIIMDVEMPVLDGLEATSAIRKDEERRGVAEPIPIIGLSGNARQEQVDDALKMGMTDYLAKPCRQPALLACVEKYLGAPMIGVDAE